LLRQLFGGHYVNLNHTEGGEWSFVFRDPRGEALDLPIPSDIGGLRAAETPTMRELKALLAEIDNDLIELGWCTTGNEPSCQAAMRDVVIEAAAAPGFGAQAAMGRKP
jgi:hypothetical protein